MTDTIVIIDQIIEEHKVLLAQANQFEKITNDAGAMKALTRSKEIFMPGRIDQVQSLKKFEELRNTIQEGLNAHFNREETYLLDAILENGDQDVITAFKNLFSEHTAFRASLSELKAESDELINGQISRSLWETKAYDMRAHVTEMNKNLEKHARNETKLLGDLRKELIKAKTGDN